MAKVSESIEIDAAPETCFKVITDYEKYPSFLKETKSVVVRKKTGQTAEVTYTIEVIKRISYTLKMIGKAPSTITWSLLEGEMMKKNSGEWNLKGTNGKTRATYSVDIEFGIFVPGMISKMLVGSNLPTMLKSFKKKIEEEERRTNR